MIYNVQVRALTTEWYFLLYAHKTCEQRPLCVDRVIFQQGECSVKDLHVVILDEDTHTETYTRTRKIEWTH